MRVFIVATPAFLNKQGIGSPYHGGGWMYLLQKKLIEHPDIELAICYRSFEPVGKKEKDGVAYYHFPPHTKNLKDKINDLIHYKDETLEEKVWPHYVNAYKWMLDDFKPDVIEVFGTETYNQLVPLAAKDIPLVLHIQGLLAPSTYSLLPPGVSRHQYIWMDKNPKAAFGRFQYLSYWMRMVHSEKNILRACKHVIGRTTWDKQCAALLAPQAHYHYGGEMLRPDFYEPCQRSLPPKPRIVTTISKPLYKGYDIVLKTAFILSHELGIDFEWLVYGNVEAKFTERNVGINPNDVNVKLCGVASPEELKKSILGSTLYFHPSYIENSSNSIAEAEILGCPVVAANIGGNGTMVEDGKMGFLFPATDPYVAAYHVKQLIENKHLNIEMGNQAKEIASSRHNVDEIFKALLRTYEEIIQEK